MLQIKNLTLTHKKDLRTILDGFNLVLNDGDKAVIIGEEGNGKSTLMKWIYNPLLIESYMEAEGEKILGKERLGYLPQEMSDEDKRKTVYEFFSEEELFWSKTPKELSVLAGKFGMTNEFFYTDQEMGSLSGGEKVKVQLMRLFIQDVTVLLLDEPSNDIDIATLELLETIINDWEHIVLFISHDETLIEHTANLIIHIEQIARKTKSRYTIARLPYRRYVEERLHQLKSQEQQALNDRKEKKIRDEKYRKVMQNVQNALANCSRQDPAAAKNLKDKMHTVKSMGRRFENFLDKSGDKEERTRIRTYLGSLKYTIDEMNRPIRELSGGQKAKVFLLKMSLSGANVLVLDEPTRNFSPLSGPVIRKILQEFPGSIISISHDRKYIDEVCDKIYELNSNGLKLLH